MSGDYNTLAWRLLSSSVCNGAKCVRCGSTRDLLAHHKVPRSYGGLDIPSNLAPVCRRCHPSAEAQAVTSAILAGRKQSAPAAQPLRAVVRRKARPVVRVRKSSPTPRAPQRSFLAEAMRRQLEQNGSR